MFVLKEIGELLVKGATEPLNDGTGFYSKIFVPVLLVKGATEPLNDGTGFYSKIFVPKCTGGFLPILNLK